MIMAKRLTYTIMDFFVEVFKEYDTLLHYLDLSRRVQPKLAVKAQKMCLIIIYNACIILHIKVSLEL